MASKGTSILMLSLKRYMLEMIRERQSGASVKRDDLLSNLLEANDGEAKEGSLTEEELMGAYSFSVWSTAQ